VAVREFNGTTDLIQCATGGLSGTTYGTFAAIFKTDDITTDHAIVDMHNSGGTFLWRPIGLTGANFIMWNGDYSMLATPTVAITTWYLGVIRKATGTATPRFSFYNFGSTTWGHGDGTTARPDGTAPGASGTLRFGDGDNAWWDGRVAVRAAWSNEVHWTADASGDTAIEAAGLHASLQNWVDESPTALWPFNQASVATPVDDIIGGADQSSISGTTVVTDDDPPGFDFSLGPAPNLWFTRAALQPR
jgi:hypothetical protein